MIGRQIAKVLAETFILTGSENRNSAEAQGLIIKRSGKGGGLQVTRNYRSNVKTLTAFA
jgi:hypothetical protein